MRKTFLIEYQIFDVNGNVIKEGKVRATNKLSAFDAQASFEVYCRKVKGFHRLYVKDCREETEIDKMIRDFTKGFDKK